MSKHSKGPWATKVGTETVVISPDDWVCILNKRFCTEANATLISAAPELLIALERVLSMFDPDSMPECGAHDAKRYAEEVVTKAKGA
jgi:hypothetical protein